MLLLLLIPILVAASLWVSTRRRRTLIQLTVGGAVGLVIIRRIGIIARDRLFERVDTQQFPSVRVLTDQLMASLFRYTAILLAIVLLTALIALITGPYPWAVTLRGWVRDGSRGVAAALSGEQLPDTGRVRWIRDHRDGLMLGGAVLALALLLLFDLSLWGFVIAGDRDRAVRARPRAPGSRAGGGRGGVGATRVGGASGPSRRRRSCGPAGPAPTRSGC